MREQGNHPRKVTVSAVISGTFALYESLLGLVPFPGQVCIAAQRIHWKSDSVTRGLQTTLLEGVRTIFEL